MASTADLDSLAVDLFRLFAQFEYCLKATGFCRSGRSGEASPDWSRFASELPSLFEPPPYAPLSEAVSYILAHPPKKQVFTDGHLQWRDVRPGSNNQNDIVLQYVRHVRNNLFHGGKFNGHWFAPERSYELLRHSLVILNGCIEASPALKEAFLQKVD